MPSLASPAKAIAIAVTSGIISGMNEPSTAVLSVYKSEIKAIGLPAYSPTGSVSPNVALLEFNEHMRKLFSESRRIEGSKTLDYIRELRDGIGNVQ